MAKNYVHWNRTYFLAVAVQTLLQKPATVVPLSSHMSPPHQLCRNDVHQTLPGVSLPTQSTPQSKKNAHESTFITPVGMCPHRRLASITVPLPSSCVQYDRTIARTNSTTTVVVDIDTNSAIEYCPVPNRCQVTSTTYRGRLGCHGIR